MTYRTPEQDARLSDLYQERDSVIDYGIKNNVDISLALDGIDAEIEALTTDLDEPDTASEAHAAMIGDDPRTPKERALDEWQAGAKETEFGTREWFAGIQPIEF